MPFSSGSVIIRVLALYRPFWFRGEPVMKQVLVVDDMLEIRTVYKALLAGPEVEVLEAEDGCRAL